MENIKGGWFMATAPVMNCKGLSIQEKVLLSCIMSMKNSMETVYATDVKILGMTGLNQDEFNDTYFSLEQKKLIRRVKNEWRIFPWNINKVLCVDVYGKEYMQTPVDNENDVRRTFQEEKNDTPEKKETTHQANGRPEQKVNNSSPSPDYKPLAWMESDYYKKVRKANEMANEKAKRERQQL